MYFPTGAATSAEIAASQMFCAPDRVPKGCTPTAGTAKPMTSECLAVFKALQVQVNRVAVGLKLKAICIDGWIGSETTATIKALPSNLPFSAPAEARAYLEQIAAVKLVELGLNAPTYTVMLRNVADTLGVPASVAGRGCKSPGVYKPASKPAPSPKTPDAQPSDEPAAPPPALPALGIKFSDPLVLAALGVVGLLLFTGKKKRGGGGGKRRGKSSSKRRAARARRRRR